jgi:DNA polymerase III sliding clamp (beta) subunit (PCNA family)
MEAAVDGPEVTAIVPASALRLAAALCDGSSATLTMSQTQTSIVANQTTLIANNITGMFPDWRQIVPQGTYAYGVVVEQAALVAAVRQASVFARDANKIVRLHLRADGLDVTAVSQETGDSAGVVDTVWQAGDTDAKAALTAYNAGYLLEVLGAMTSEHVRLVWDSGGRPGVLTTAEDPTLWMIMPMHVAA